MAKVKEIDDVMIASLRNQQEMVKESLRKFRGTPEIREILSDSILKMEEQIRDIQGATRMHKKGGAVMKKRGGTFKGVF